MWGRQKNQPLEFHKKSCHEEKVIFSCVSHSKIHFGTMMGFNKIHPYLEDLSSVPSPLRSEAVIFMYLIVNLFLNSKALYSIMYVI